MRIEYSRLATRDLNGIRRYTRRKWGLLQAIRYLAALGDAALSLTRGTLKARPAGLPKSTILRTLVGKHYLYLEVTQDVLFISRVLHGNMNVERKSFPRWTEPHENA